MVIFVVHMGKRIRDIPNQDDIQKEVVIQLYKQGQAFVAHAYMAIIGEFPIDNGCRYTDNGTSQNHHLWFTTNLILLLLEE